VCYYLSGEREDPPVFSRMDKPDAAMKARLAACVIDERTRRVAQGGDKDREGARGSTSEDSGMSSPGRPRKPKGRRREPVSRFDAHYTWRG
jgi:hypothetical protein